PNSGKPEFGGEGGERSEPGEGRSVSQLKLESPSPRPSPPRSGLPDLRTIDAELGQARVRAGRGRANAVPHRSRPAIPALPQSLPHAARKTHGWAAPVAGAPDALAVAVI